MSDELYYLKYHVEGVKEGFTVDEVENPHGGACDCVVIGSILGTPLQGGSVSYAFFGVDGHTSDQLTPAQMFRAGVAWSHALIDCLPLGRQRAICIDAFAAARALVVKDA